MASYSPLNNQSGLNTNSENKGFFSRALRDLSSWGMKYDDMISRNRVSVGINEDPAVIKNTSMYDFFSQRAISSMLSKKSIPYLDRSYIDKRSILREYSIKDEIRDYITKVADEIIVYDDKMKFCYPKNIPDNLSQEVKDKYMESFENIYHSFGFSDGKYAWDLARRFLIDGFLTFEIVYDDKNQEIIKFEEIDPGTLVPGYEPSIGYIWIQFPDDPQLRKVLLDSQIVHISYSSSDDFTETSYVEALIRPYNQLKIIEQTRIMFNMANATHYQKFTVPVGGLSRQKAEGEVSKLIANYSEETEFDDTLGTVSINGTKKIPYNKQIWFPEGENGSPTMEIVSPDGHDLNESDILTWFYNSLKRASQIPFSRFDKDNGGGNLYSDAAEMTRDEVQFSNFVQRIRASFRELIEKPLKLQMLIEFPELKEDRYFTNNIGVNFNSKELFEEWKRLNNLQKRTSIAADLLSSIQDTEGNPYFHTEWVINNIMQLTEEQKQENKSYFIKYPNGSDEEQEGDSDTGGSDFDTGGDDDLGDVGGDTDTGGDDFDF